MTFSLFSVSDVVAKSVLFVSNARNSSEFIRTNLRNLAQLYPLRDLRINRIAELDELNGTITDFRIIDAEPVDWSDYKFPETQAEALQPLGIQEVKLASGDDSSPNEN